MLYRFCKGQVLGGLFLAVLAFGKYIRSFLYFVHLIVEAIKRDLYDFNCRCFVDQVGSFNPKSYNQLVVASCCAYKTKPFDLSYQCKEFGVPARVHLPSMHDFHSIGSLTTVLLSITVAA